MIRGQLAAAYLDCTIEQLPGEALDLTQNAQVWQAELFLIPDVFPIRRYSQFEDPLNRNTTDPLAGILAAVAARSDDPLRSQIEITVRPVTRWRHRIAQDAVGRLASPRLHLHRRLARMYGHAIASRSRLVRLAGHLCGTCVAGKVQADLRLSLGSGRLHDREGDLQAASDKVGRALFQTHIRLTVVGPPELEDEARAKLYELAGAFGQFSLPRLSRLNCSRVRGNARFRVPSPGFLLSAEELATLWHPATETVRTPTMEMTLSREMEPPVSIPSREKEADVAELGLLKFRDRNECFGIRSDDRLRHLAIIGKTGMGKSTLLQRLMVSDIRAGRGVALIDPHGDLAEGILQCVPNRRTNDVVLFDAGDRDFPVSFNPLSRPAVEQRPLVAAGVVSAFKKRYGVSWGPRLEYILRNALLTLLEQQGTSLASLLRLLSDKHYRKGITAQLGDPVLRSFWQHEYEQWSEKYRSEAVALIQNKVGQFLSHPVLRRIVGQARSTLDLRQVMDDGRILIVNLSKGRIGEGASTLLGSLLVTQLQLAAMSRAEIREADRTDFFAYVDEFQNFATESFATILSEARKYRLSLTIANQYLAQMDEQTADAVFGNVGSMLIFQVWGNAIRRVNRVPLPDRDPEDLEVPLPEQPETPPSMEQRQQNHGTAGKVSQLKLF